MVTITVDGREFLLEFRHVRKEGKRAELHRGPVKAITTCVVIGMNAERPVDFMAIDNAICIDSDNFSRREGRMRSLSKLLDHCVAMKSVRDTFLEAYLKIDPPRLPHPKPAKLSQVEIALRIEEGAKTRVLRAERNKALVAKS